MTGADTGDGGEGPSWQRTLVVVWIAQYLSIAAFAFGLPFAAFYIQALGVTDPDAVRHWTALFQGLAPLAFCFAAPVWGMLSDRHGRRLMLLRAQCCAVAILFGMGMAESVGMLLLLRVAQGLFTGTMSAAQTLVAVSTPADRQGLALGALSTAVFAGALTGQAIGGWCADLFGYRASFFIGAGLSLASFLLLLFGTRERFVPVLRVVVPGRRRLLPSLGPGLPLLLLIAATSTTVHMDLPILPLLVQQLRGGALEGSATAVGALVAVGSFAAMVAGTVMGHLVDRIAPTRVAAIAAVGAACACIPFAFAAVLGLAPLYAAKFCLSFCAAGLDPVFLIWLSRETAAERRGSILGWAATARSVGWMCGPLAASVLASPLGLAGVYPVQSICFLLLIPVALWATRAMRGAAAPGQEQEQEPEPAPAKA